jgi:hypothetical protein
MKVKQALLIALAGLAFGPACNTADHSTPAPYSEGPAQSSPGSDVASPASGDSTGAIGVHLAIPSGQNIPVLSWSITGPNGAATVVNSGDAQSVSAGASFLVGGIPTASGYSISVSGTATDGSLTCTGSAPFSIGAQQTTNVLVELACSVATSGAHVVLANGTSFNCAASGNVSASPTATSVGSSVMLSATAAAPLPSAITYSWSAPSGTLGAPSSATTSFVCTSAGVVNVTLAVGDGPVPAGNSCSAALSTKTVPVTCDAGNGPPPAAPAMPPWAVTALAACVMAIGSFALRLRVKQQ